MCKVNLAHPNLNPGSVPDHALFIFVWIVKQNCKIVELVSNVVFVSCWIRGEIGRLVDEKGTLDSKEVSSPLLLL